MENKLQQAKDTIAKKYGYANFEQFDDKSTFGYNHDTPKIIDEVAIEYHRLMSDWVSVDERLPEITDKEFNDSDYCLCINMEGSHHIPFIAYYNSSYPKWIAGSWVDNKNVTHWKLLPQPPQK